MRVLAALGVVIALAACTNQGATPGDPQLSAELIRLAREDQVAREGFAAAASNDAAYFEDLVAGDSARTERLKEIVAAHGWPTVSLVGREGVEAAWLLLQHSPDTAWQAAMLPVVERAAAAGEIRPADVALLTDRVLVRSARPQRYGNSFSVVDGRLVADPIEDEVNVDVRRAAVGLPPMAEYAQTLSEVYGLPVEWPRQPK